VIGAAEKVLIYYQVQDFYRLPSDKTLGDISVTAPLHEYLLR
jgi:hypothetical protein